MRSSSGLGLGRLRRRLKASERACTRNGLREAGGSRSLEKQRNGAKGLEEVDVVLSSGFLAFARHIGALKAIDAHGGFRIDSMMCTSSGAIVGSLIAAGYSTDDTADVIKELSPYKYLTPSREPWRGCFRLDRLVQRMRSLLPERFEQLQIPLACGAVSKRTGEHICIRSGPLPEAVVSSAAVPVLFKPVAVPGRESDTYLVDGGVSDRIALRPYRESVGSSNRRAICHVVKRSSSRFGGDDSIPQLVKDFERWHDIFIQSPRARESMLGFRAFDFQVQESKEIAERVLAGEEFDAYNSERKPKRIQLPRLMHAIASTDKERARL